MSTPPDDYGIYEPGPFPIYPPVDLSKKKYPEKSPFGLGRSALLPSSYWAFMRWVGLKKGDFTGLRIKDLTRPIASGNVLEDKDLYFVSFDGNLIEDGDHDYFGRILRVGSNQEDRSEIQSMLFKKSKPGGDDPNDDEPWHSALLVSIDGLREGAIVTQDVIKRGLKLWVQPYPHIRFNDENIFTFGGRPFTYIVSPTDASGNKPYSVDIPAEDLDDITEYGPFSMRMGLRDVVGNEPESKFKLSKPYALFSDLVPGRLRQALLTLNDEEISEVDLDEKPNVDYVAFVFPRRKPKPIPTPRLRVVLFMVITRADGSTDTVSFGPVADRNLETESISVSHNDFNNMGPGRARFYYESQTSTGEVLETSASNMVYVIGEQTQMGPLKLKPYNLGLVPRDSALETTFPEYAPFKSTYIAKVILRTKSNDNGVTILTSKQFADKQGAVRLFDRAAMKRLENKGPFEALYEVDPATGKPPRSSEIVEAEIGEGLADLPAVYIEKLTPHHGYLNLDPNDLDGDGVLMRFLYPGTVAGDELHYNVVGESPKSSTQGIIKISKAIEGPALRDLDIPIGQQVIDDNLNRCMYIYYSVVTSGVTPVVLRSEVLRFSVGEPIELDYLKLVESNAADATISPLASQKGWTLEMAYTPPVKGDSITFKGMGEFGISQHTEVVEFKSKAKVFKSHFPVEAVTRGLRPNGNNFVFECIITRGPFKYVFAPLRLRLLALELPALYIEGYENATELPLHQMTKVNVIVPPRIFGQEGQYFWAEVSGTLQTGEAFTDELAVARKLTAAEATNGLSISWPLARAREVRDGSPITLNAKVSFPGIPLVQTTTPYSAKSIVVSQIPPVLNAPLLIDGTGAQTETVDAVVFESKVNVSATVKGMLTSDKLVMTCTTQSGANIQLAASGNVSGTVVFNFTPHKIIHNSVGGWMQFRYTLSRNGKVTPSHVLTVNVSAISAARNPVVTINNQAVQSTLDLNRIPGSLFYSVARWPLIKQDQRVWVDLVGSGRTQAILANYAIPSSVEAGGIVGFGLPRSALLNLPKNSWIYLQVWVEYAGVGNRAQAVLVSQSAYILNDSFVPSDILLVNGLAPWVRGSGAADSHFTATGLYMNSVYHGRGESYAGPVLSANFDLNPGHTYYISVVVLNITPGPPYNHVDPVLSISVGGRVVHGAYSLPKHTWAYLNVSFGAAAAGPTTIVIYNHTASGKGNDFYIHAIQVIRTT